MLITLTSHRWNCLKLAVAFVLRFACAVGNLGGADQITQEQYRLSAHYHRQWVIRLVLDCTSMRVLSCAELRSGVGVCILCVYYEYKRLPETAPVLVKTG